MNTLAINPIFNNLRKIKENNKNTLWVNAFDDKYAEVYKPILTAFKNELQRLYESDLEFFSSKLVHYLVGYNDFYKIIKKKKKLEIQAQNLNYFRQNHLICYSSIGDLRHLQRLNFFWRFVQK